MGPEGGVGGGTVVAEGDPEDVATVAESYTASSSPRSWKGSRRRRLSADSPGEWLRPRPIDLRISSSSSWRLPVRLRSARRPAVPRWRTRRGPPPIRSRWPRASILSRTKSNDGTPAAEYPVRKCRRRVGTGKYRCGGGCHRLFDDLGVHDVDWCRWLIRVWSHRPAYVCAGAANAIREPVPCTSPGPSPGASGAGAFPRKASCNPWTADRGRVQPEVGLDASTSRRGSGSVCGPVEIDDVVGGTFGQAQLRRPRHHQHHDGTW